MHASHPKKSNSPFRPDKKFPVSHQRPNSNFVPRQFHLPSTYYWHENLEFRRKIVTTIPLVKKTRYVFGKVLMRNRIFYVALLMLTGESSTFSCRLEVQNGLRQRRSGMGGYTGTSRRRVHFATVLLRAPSDHRPGRRRILTRKIPMGGILRRESRHMPTEA